MVAMATIDEFMAQEALAIVGVSRGGRGFGNAAMRELRADGYRVFPVHPEAGSIQGVACARSLGELRERAGGVVVSVPPERAEGVVREAAAAGIRRVWLQHGSWSPRVLAACAESGVEAIHGECVLMFLRRGAAFHRFHRALKRLVGRLPR